MATDEYWVDRRFVDERQAIDLSNLHEYFRGHPDYDFSCNEEKVLNNQQADPINGIEYSFSKEAEHYYIITKYKLIEGVRKSVENFMVWGPNIFKCKNLKDVIMRKIENLTSLTRHLQDIIDEDS